MEITSLSESNLPFYGVECANSISFTKNKISVGDLFFIRLFIDDVNLVNNINMSSCNISVKGKGARVEIYSQIPPQTNMTDISDANITITDCVFDCPDSVVLIKTNGGTIAMKNVVLNCKQLVIESTIYGKIVIGQDCKFNVSESIDFLCGGGDTLIDSNVSIKCDGTLKCYNMPYTPIMENDKLVTMNYQPNVENTLSRLIIFESSINIKKDIVAIGLCLIIRDEATINSSTLLLEMKEMVFICGKIDSGKIKITTKQLQFLSTSSVDSVNNVILNCGYIKSEGKVTLRKGKVIMQSVNDFVNFGQLSAIDIIGWFDSPLGNGCSFHNYGRVELENLSIKNENGNDFIKNSNTYLVNIQNGEQGIITINRITTLISNLKNGIIILSNEGSISFKGDFKTLFENTFGKIKITNNGNIQFNSNLYLFGTELESYNQISVYGKTKLMVKELHLQGNCQFKNDVTFIGDEIRMNGNITFTKDLTCNVCKDMVIQSRMKIDGSLLINMTKSQPFNFLTLDDMVEVGKNFTITAPNLYSDNLEMKQKEIGSNNFISVINTQFHGNLKCMGNVNFVVKRMAEFNSTISAECSVFNIGSMYGSLNVKGGESDFTVDYLYGKLNFEVNRGADLKITNHASSSSSINIHANNATLKNSGKQLSSEVKVKVAEDFLASFAFDVDSNVNIKSNNGLVQYVSGGSVRKSHKIDANRVIFICGDTIVAPTTLKSVNEVLAHIGNGVHSDMNIESKEKVDYVNNGDQTSTVSMKGREVDSSTKGSISGVHNMKATDNVNFKARQLENGSSVSSRGTNNFIQTNNISNGASVNVKGENSDILGREVNGRVNVNVKQNSNMNFNHVNSSADINSRSKTGTLTTKIFSPNSASLKTNQSSFELYADKVNNQNKLEANQLTVNSNYLSNTGGVKANKLTVNSTYMVNDGSISAQQVNLNTVNQSLGKNSTISTNILNISTTKLTDHKNSEMKAKTVNIQKQDSQNVNSQISSTNLAIQSNNYNLHNLNNLKSENVLIDISKVDKSVNSDLNIDPQIKQFALKVNSLTNNSNMTGNFTIISSNNIDNNGSITGDYISLNAKKDILKGNIYGRELEKVVAGKRIIIPPLQFKEKQVKTNFFWKTVQEQQVREFSNRKDIIYEAGEGDLDFSHCIISNNGETSLNAKKGVLNVVGSKITSSNSVYLGGSKGVIANSNKESTTEMTSKKNLTIHSEEAGVNVEGVILKADLDIQIIAKNSIQANTILEESLYSSYSFFGKSLKVDDSKKQTTFFGKNVYLQSDEGNISANNSQIHATKVTSISAPKGVADISHQKQYIDNVPHLHGTNILTDQFKMNSKFANLTGATVATKSGGFIQTEQDINADSVIDKYVAESWSSSGFLGFNKSSGYREQAVFLPTRILTNGRFDITSSEGAISAKGIQSGSQNAQTINMKAKKDIDLSSKKIDVHFSRSSSSWWGCNSSTTSGYKTNGHMATIVTNDSINVRSLEGRITGEAFLISNTVDLHAKKSIDIKQMDIESFIMKKESSFQFLFFSPPSLVNNAIEIFQRLESMKNSNDGVTGLVSDLIGLGFATYNTGVNLAQLALSDWSMVKDTLLSCFDVGIGYKETVSSSYTKSQVSSGIKTKNLRITVDDEDGYANFNANINSESTILNVKNVIFNNNQTINEKKQSSSSFEFKVNLLSLIEGAPSFSASASHSESKSNTVINKSNMINLGKVHLERDTNILNRGNKINMDTLSGKKLNIIDEDMQDENHYTSKGGSVSVGFSLSDLKGISFSGQYGDHHHVTTKQDGKAHTKINNYQTLVNQEHITKKDIHKDVSLSVSFNSSALTDDGPEVHMPLKISGQFGDFKFRLEIPPPNVTEKMKKGFTIMGNAEKHLSGKQSINALSETFHFKDKQSAEQAEHELRQLLVKGVPFENGISHIQHKYQVFTFEQEQQILEEEKRKRQNIENMEQLMFDILGKETKEAILQIERVMLELKENENKKRGQQGGTEKNRNNGNKGTKGDESGRGGNGDTGTGGGNTGGKGGGDNGGEDTPPIPPPPTALRQFVENLIISGVQVSKDKIVKAVSVVGKEANIGAARLAWKVLSPNAKSSLVGLCMNAQVEMTDLKPNLNHHIQNLYNPTAYTPSSGANQGGTIAKKNLSPALTKIGNGLGKVVDGAMVIVSDVNEKYRQPHLIEKIGKVFLPAWANTGLALGELYIHSKNQEKSMNGLIVDSLSQNNLLQNFELFLDVCASCNFVSATAWQLLKPIQKGMAQLKANEYNNLSNALIEKGCTEEEVFDYIWDNAMADMY